METTKENTIQLGENQPILLLEDDKIDIITMQRAFKTLNIVNPLHVVNNGEEGLDYLENCSTLPCLIILDINMPKMNGIEFLERIKKVETLKKIPSVVLTTSKDQQDKLNSFNLSIAGYMIKPVDNDQFVNMVETITEYWRWNEFPS